MNKSNKKHPDEKEDKALFNKMFKRKEMKEKDSKSKKRSK